MEPTDYAEPGTQTAENFLSFVDTLLKLPEDYRWREELLVLASELSRRMLDYPGLRLPKEYGEQLTSRLDDLRARAEQYDWQQFADEIYTYLNKYSYDEVKTERFEASAEAVAEAPAVTKARIKKEKQERDERWRRVLDDFSPDTQRVLLLALVPHLYAGFLDQLLHPLLALGGALPELGGAQGTAYRGLLPTGDTALFLLSGTNPTERTRALTDVLAPSRPLLQSRMLTLGSVPAGEPRLSGLLTLEPQLLEFLLTGAVARPAEPAPEPAPEPTPAADFPAQPLSTDLGWTDLVLPRATRLLVDDISSWLHNAATLRYQWGLDALLKPGYRALFYGPSGTGKTLTATLLGKQLGRTVYRVDLSMVLSKYIGETEKSLGRLFEQAQSQNWILFFDEADALFGKRTETRDAHDRFANQEVAFLLQKVEEYDGLVILATNLKGNIDAAFSRRFQAMIPFPMPTPAERTLLWQKTLLGLGSRAQGLPVEQWAARYELTGASILNVVQFAALRALGRSGTRLEQADVLEGVRLEYQKDGKLL